MKKDKFTPVPCNKCEGLGRIVICVTKHEPGADRKFTKHQCNDCRGNRILYRKESKKKL